MKINQPLYNLLTWLSCLFLLVLISCNKEDDCKTTEFFNDGDHVFTYECDGEDIRFLFDVPSDTTNNITGTWPDKDIFRIFVDLNRNGVLDPDVDFVVSTDSGDRTCVSTLTGQTTANECLYYEDVASVDIWAPSGNSSENHIGFQLVIPKSFLSEVSVAHLVVHLHDADQGWTYFPTDNELFSDVFEISW